MKVWAPGPELDRAIHDLRVLFEQTWILSPKASFIPNINTFQPVVHEKKIFEYLSKFSLFFPLLGSKRPAPLFEQIWIPILQVWFLPSLVEIGPVILEKKLIKEKLTDDDADAGDGRILMAIAHEPSSQVSLKKCDRIKR